MNYDEIISLMLPDGMLNYFTVVKTEKNKEYYTIYLEENNVPPEEYSKQRLISKGFYDAVTVQDFPLRGKACYLNVKRRRWTNIDTGQIVCRDWTIVAKGTRMTQEFASFLKAINRY
jgi:hypothetical protein